ncbi:unnamed protein product [Notodromas monacha]|uniref:Mediator of RNA polymerase II transcription subunit 30 n=1 Tax=Notodromas monacha TaxID=399045 RepID=A0A7R9BM37_9CRUS|nr:unnamed protein product [Notodromas monacha]CAG0917126.1 unnamed protein product [Notodromas monacha]
MSGNPPFSNQQQGGPQQQGMNVNYQNQYGQGGQFGQYSPVASQQAYQNQGQQFQVVRGPFPSNPQQSPQYSFQGNWQQSTLSPQQQVYSAGNPQMMGGNAMRFQKPSPQHQPSFIASQNSPASAGLQQQQQRPIPSPQQYQRSQTPSDSGQHVMTSGPMSNAPLASPMPSQQHSQPHTPQPPPSVEQKPPSVSSVHQSPMSQGPMTPGSQSAHSGQFPSTPATVAPATPQSNNTPVHQLMQQQQAPLQQHLTMCCRLGQESVVEIVTRGTDLLNTLKSFQIIGGVPQANAGIAEKKAKVAESLKYLSQVFKRLRVCYDRVASASLELGEDFDLSDALPIQGKSDIQPGTEKRNHDFIRQASEEHRELTEQLVTKNRQLKEIIDVMRGMVNRPFASFYGVVSGAVGIMAQFNVKKFVNEAGTLLNRAVQYTEEKFGTSEKTELDAHFENLAHRADLTKKWTEKLVADAQSVIIPNPGNRVEDYLTEMIEKRKPNRMSNLEWLGMDMISAGNEYGPGTSFGSALLKVGQYEQKLGAAEREFISNAAQGFVHPMQKFLDGEMRTIVRERKMLETKRLDLDCCKSKLRKARSLEAQHNLKEGIDPKQMIAEAERDLRNAQYEFDRQTEVTKLLLEGISSAHTGQLHSLNDFVDAQLRYYAQCHQLLQDLSRELNSLTLGTGNVDEPVSSGAGGDGKKTKKKARVLYDYDAKDPTELSLLADEVITVFGETATAKDDYVPAERGSKRGKVPTMYLEMLD